MQLVLGIDIGSVSVKVALLECDGRVIGIWSKPILESPCETLRTLLAGIPPPAGGVDVVIGITGTGRSLAHGGIHKESEVIALAEAMPSLCPDALGAIEIGGHSSRFVTLDPVTRALRDFGLNQHCAAGSGVFFEQQASRLGMSVEEFGKRSHKAPRGATVAGRCSVFAKSDMIHLQQKGTPLGEIAYGLCLAMVRNFMATVLRGRTVIPPLALTGGAAANPGLVRAFAEVLELDMALIRVSPHPGAEGAVGAALSALTDPATKAVPWPLVITTLALSEPHAELSTCPSLTIAPSPDEPFAPLSPDQVTEAYLGVDVGSVSTNLVLLLPDGRLAEGIYLPTRGQPIAAVGLGLAQIRARFRSHLRILGVAVTGSGRHLAAGLLGADLVKNEITCQLRGAVLVDPEVDTIFEIGGQDSKYIGVRNGRIADFTMNKICAAGTGSFLEEQSEHLAVAIVGEFASLAARSAAPADLGRQCTVFMHSELMGAEQRGASKADLCAGLAYSVAHNYLERVVAGRPVGRHVIFQGGVAHNAAVVAAFRQILNCPVRVHPHAGISGAIGAADLIREARPARTSFRGLDTGREHKAVSFECTQCSNRCEVSQFEIGGQKVYFGDACERYSSRAIQMTSKAIPDLLARWQEIERPFLTPPASVRCRIGIPLSSFFLGMRPFWTTFFTSLGIEVVTSPPTSRTTLQAALRKLPAETCLPIKLAFGHIQELTEAGVERIFLPSILKHLDDDPLYAHSCPYVQALPYMVKASLDGIFMTPEVSLSGGEEAVVEALAPALHEMGVKRTDIARAYHLAVATWTDFRHRLIEAGNEVLQDATRALVIIGKPYNVLDPFLNLNLFQHLRHLGVTALPMWCLPFDKEDLEGSPARLPWHLNRDMIRAVRFCERHDSLYPVVVSNFGCGPDAFTQMNLEQSMNGRPVLFLEFDEHRAEAGLITRLEAYLDNIAAPRQPQHAVSSPPPIPEAPAPSHFSWAAPQQVPLRHSFVIPYFSDHAHVFSGALKAIGHTARVLPQPSSATRRLGETHSSGKECHPYCLLTGDLVNFAQSPRAGHEIFLFPGTSIPCLLYQYGDEQRLLLHRLKIDDLTVMTPRMGDLKDLLGMEIGARLWRGLVAVDLLIKMVCATRPYERERGQTDAVHSQNLRDIETAMETDELPSALALATARLRLIPLAASEPRPVVGVAGDIFTRINPVGNQDLFAWLEEQGCEVWPAPFIVDIMDFSIRRQWFRGSMGETALLGALMLRKNVETWRVLRSFRNHGHSTDASDFEEPGFEDILNMAAPYIGREQNAVLILNIAKMIDFARRKADGILNAACFNCMLGTVSAAITNRIRDDYDGIPIVNLVYSGLEGSQHALLTAFLHQVKINGKRKGGSHEYSIQER